MAGVSPIGEIGVSASGGPIHSQDSKPISFNTGPFGAPATTSQSLISNGTLILTVVVILWLVLTLKR